MAGACRREVTGMAGQLSNWIRTCAQQFAAKDWDDRSEESRALENAHRDWLAAGRMFDYATEPDLVDYAIYSLQAAEKQFVYLWKRARQQV